MSNFGKPLKEMTEEELRNCVDKQSWEMANLPLTELAIRSLNSLQKTIQIFNEKSSEQTSKLLILTCWIVGLTIVLVVGLVIQIFPILVAMWPR
ncbi:MAG: hypothetical protein PHE24_04510 [Patescibacteria group bacterium]|nr:hypothetical protein [Patescibacteria group bacterium]